MVEKLIINISDQEISKPEIMDRIEGAVFASLVATDDQISSNPIIVDQPNLSKLKDAMFGPNIARVVILNFNDVRVVPDSFFPTRSAISTMQRLGENYDQPTIKKVIDFMFSLRFGFFGGIVQSSFDKKYEDNGNINILIDSFDFDLIDFKNNIVDTLDNSIGLGVTNKIFNNISKSISKDFGNLASKIEKIESSIAVIENTITVLPDMASSLRTNDIKLDKLLMKLGA